MAYGNYSEVYFGIDFDNTTRIKIGETTNARRRQKQLDVIITRCVEVGGNHHYRLLIEALLREKISRLPNVINIGNDYFICDSQKTVLFIEQEFEKWVEIFQKNVEKLLTN